MTLNKSYIFLPDSSSRSERWAEELFTGTEQLRCRYPALPTRVAHSPAGWRGVKLKEKQTQEPLASPAMFFPPVHFLYIKKRATLQLEKTPGYFLIIFIIFFQWALSNIFLGWNRENIIQNFVPPVLGYAKLQPCPVSPAASRGMVGPRSGKLGPLINDEEREEEKWEGEKAIQAHLSSLAVMRLFLWCICLNEMKVWGGNILLYKSSETYCGACAETLSFVYWSWSFLTPLLKK